LRVKSYFGVLRFSIENGEENGKLAAEQVGPVSLQQRRLSSTAFGYGFVFSPAEAA
jgi:hypothetical protein